MRFARLTIAVLAGSLTACEAAQGVLDDLVGERDPGAIYIGTGLLPDGGEAAQAPPDAGTESVLEVGPLLRAEKKYPFVAKGGSNIGFRLETHSRQFALDGAMEVPDWSAPSDGEPRTLRDDNLDTGWRCTATDETRCAVGIHFPRPAAFRAVRMFAAGGQQAAARIKRIRIHTDEGFSDALLPNIDGHVYAVVGHDLKTVNLTIEVLETFGGKTDTIEIGELEFYGADGVARAPLNIDPARTFVELSKPRWRKRGRDSYDLGRAYISVLDDSGAAHRFAVGSALRGVAGDRMLLIERIEGQIGCGSPQGTFFLLDQKTRMVSPVGELGGVGSDVFRTNDGEGIATGYDGKLATFLHGVFAENSVVKQRRTPLREDKATGDYFALWGLQKEPVPRGGVGIQGMPGGCTPPTPEALSDLPTPKRGKPAPRDPSSWVVCKLGADHRAFVGGDAHCGEQTQIHVLDSAGASVGTKTIRAAGSHVFLRRLDEDALLVEAGNAKDNTVLLRLTNTGVDTVGDAAGMVVRPPAKCRKTCDAPFVNPREPTYQ